MLPLSLSLSSLKLMLSAILAPVPIVLTVLAFAVGYQARAYISPVVVGPGAPKSFSTSAPAEKKQQRSNSPVPAPSGGTDSESDGEDEAAANAADLKAVRAGGDEIKLVLVVNDSLKMTKGKIGAQCGHATLACYETLARSNPNVCPEACGFEL
jgi:PTH2 family peptidyl-tRNA hydrolase